MATYQNPLPIKNIGDPFVLARARMENTIAMPPPRRMDSKPGHRLILCTGRKKDTSILAQKTPGASLISGRPKLVLHDGKYFMHYSARWGKNQSLRIGVAVADSPTGPFLDVFNRPMFDFGYAAIDGHVLIDDDGHKYLYYSRDCSENIVDGRHESHLYVANSTMI